MVNKKIAKIIIFFEIFKKTCSKISTIKANVTTDDGIILRSATLNVLISLTREKLSLNKTVQTSKLIINSKTGKTERNICFDLKFFKNRSNPKLASTANEKENINSILEGCIEDNRGKLYL